MNRAAICAVQLTMAPTQTSLLPDDPEPMDPRDAALVSWCRTNAPAPVLSDTIEAADAWGANCGPMSLAAVLGLPTVEAVHDFVRPEAPRGGGRAEFRGWMSPTDMLKAIRNSGALWRSSEEPWPSPIGLVRIQWLGPWMEASNPRAAYRYTHWIGVRTIEEEKESNSGSCRCRSFSREVMVYDATPNRWIPLWAWERWCSVLWPKRATGWAPVTRIDVVLK